MVLNPVAPEPDKGSKADHYVILPKLHHRLPGALL